MSADIRRVRHDSSHRYSLRIRRMASIPHLEPGEPNKVILLSFLVRLRVIPALGNLTDVVLPPQPVPPVYEARPKFQSHAEIPIPQGLTVDHAAAQSNIACQ
jgi:hypothetical protein